ncbi:SRPBCC family protein [Coraliomargarita sp. SDUM461003]|uniref:SRPBCC family protein n=1 Tax=Thalassobacterium maritimum TaxID=3041265 RepID=A0ABU1APL2_9BACT|nr:SRPBCC family protein [Coraliomargarita sp. SDUM461003]MDQ8206112.1 SRPBCC family protein [Coraliomargarita sp. SDUM461003]
MPTIHQLEREQTIATELETAWNFISAPQNLDRITPDDMDFEIVSKLPEQMYNGLLIEYRVGIPLIGKQTWLTELKHIREQHSFVDEQRIGPYRLWYHYHEITAVAGGVRFNDRVSYVMPFGPFGALARGLYVKKELERIFDYRQKAMLAHLAN